MIERKHVLEVNLQADTKESLIHDLHQMATDIAMGKMTTGCYGSPSSNAVYSYRINHTQTHENYFDQIIEMLKKECSNE